MKKIITLLIALTFVAGCTSTSTKEDTSERMSRGNYEFFENEKPFDHFEKDYSE